MSRNQETQMPPPIQVGKENKVRGNLQCYTIKGKEEIMPVVWFEPRKKASLKIGDFIRCSNFYLKFSKEVHTNLFGGEPYLRLGFDLGEPAVLMLGVKEKEKGFKISNSPSEGVVQVVWQSFVKGNQLSFAKPCDIKIQDFDKKIRKISLSNCK